MAMLKNWIRSIRWIYCNFCKARCISSVPCFIKSVVFVNSHGHPFLIYMFFSQAGWSRICAWQPSMLNKLFMDTSKRNTNPLLFFENYIQYLWKAHKDNLVKLILYCMQTRVLLIQYIALWNRISRATCLSKKCV